VAALVLAAGTGTRLRPLTAERPKALCPVAGRTLLDRALGLLADAGVIGAHHVAVNAHHHASQIEAAVAGRATCSVEPTLLGSAGAIGRLRRWIDGRDLVVLNVDAVHGHSVTALVDHPQDPDTDVAFVAAEPPGTEFHDRLSIIGWRIPGRVAMTMPDEFAMAYSLVWRPAVAAQRARVTSLGGPFFDCGTPADYLAAHRWLGGTSPLVWDGAHAGPGVGLDAIVTPARTVLVR
jgi:N-acetyl-alpha-D-muramate 1-phosphate uridylyltransferase